MAKSIKLTGTNARLLDHIYLWLKALSIAHLHIFLVIIGIDTSLVLGSNEFPGDYTDEVTPDPIPNSVAKLV